MKNRLLTNPWIKVAAGALLAGTLASGISGCDDGVRVRSVVYGSSIYDPFDYYYYPYSRIYFSISTGFYYYPDGNNWIKTRTLPSRYYIDPRDRVTLKIKTNDQPYLWHNEHKVRYTARPNYRIDKNRDRSERNQNLDRYKKSRRR